LCSFVQGVDLVALQEGVFLRGSDLEDDVGLEGFFGGDDLGSSGKVVLVGD